MSASPAVWDRGESEVMLAGQNRVLEMIATQLPLEQTLGTLMRLIEAQFEGMLCSILLLDEDGLHVRHGAAPSLPEAYIQAIDGVPIGPKAGSCGTAMYRKEPVIVTDILTDPLWEDYRDLAKAHGLRACWSTPIIAHQGRMLGSFAMYYREPRIPGLAAARYIEMATHIASIAIERCQAEEALRQAEQKYRNIFEQAVLGIFQSSPDGSFLSVNPALARLFGFESPQEMTKHVTDIPRQF